MKLKFKENQVKLLLCHSKMKLVITMIEIRVLDWRLILGYWNLDLGTAFETEIGAWDQGLGLDIEN